MQSWGGGDDIELVQSYRPHDTGIARIAVERCQRRHVLSASADGALALSDLRNLAEGPKARAPSSKVDEEGGRSSSCPEATQTEGLGHCDTVEGLAWLPGEDRLFASGALDGHVKVWDAASSSSALCTVLDLDLRRAVRGLAIADPKCGAQLAVALGDCTVRLVDLRSGRAVNTLQGHTKPPLSVVWGDPSMGHLYSGGMDGTIRAWDPRMGARSLFLFDPYAHEDPLPLRRFEAESPEAVGRPPEEWEYTRDARLEPYRFRSMKSVLGTHQPRIGSAVAMGATTLYTPEVSEPKAKSDQEDERRRELWKQEAEAKRRHAFGPRRREFAHEAAMAHRGAVRSVCFATEDTSDFSCLLSCGVDGKVRCWDPETGAPKKAKAEPPHTKRKVEANGMLLCAKYEEVTWRPEINVDCSTEEQGLHLAALCRQSLCLVPEEELIAVYCARSGRCLCRLAAHRGSVTGLEALHPNREEVLSAGKDGLLLSWRTGRPEQGEIIAVDD